MSIYIRIKRLVGFSPEKKQSIYQREKLRPRGVAVKNDSYTRAGTSGRLDVLKSLLRKKRAVNPNIYTSKPPPKRSKRMFRSVAFCFVLIIVYFSGGDDVVLEKLQEIEFFKITQIDIVGNSTVTREKIRTTADIIAHQTSLLGMKSAVIEKKLLDIPWIAGASVKRDWPSTVRIEVVENVPLALIHKNSAEGSRLQYIDRYGHSFLSVNPGSRVDLPVVTGLAEIRDSAIYDAALAEVLIFLNKVKTNDPHLPVQSLSEVHVNPGGDLVVYLVEYPFPIFFGNGNTKQKYDRLVEVLKALYKKEKGKDLISEVEYIQMDYLQDKVLVAQSGQG